MANKFLFIILLLIVIVVIVGLFTSANLTGLFTSNNDDVSSKVESLYELTNPGVNVSIVKIDKVSGMYKVLFKAVDVVGGTTYQEVYITQDGELLTENMILVDQSIAQLSRIHNFVDCLEGKDVRIAGITNQTATLLQFNVLGGSYATARLYLSCDGEFAQQCIASNITEVPTVVYQDLRYPGVQTIEFFENLTACKF